MTTPLRHNRDWTLLMTGATVSAVGSGMSGLAFLMIAFTLTGSSVRAGLVAGSYALGQVLVMLPAGTLVDHWDRKRTMVLTTITGAALFASIPLAALAGHLTFGHLLLVAVCEGALACFYSPAEQAALKKIVPDEQMGTAMSATMARSSLGSLVGPPLSGVLFGLSRTLPFVVDALSYLWAAGCAALVHTELPAPRRTTRRHLLADTMEGFRWIWHTPAVRDMTAAGLGMNFGLNGALTTAILALQRQGVSPTRLGLLDTAAGIAGLTGAAIAPWLVNRMRIGRLTLASLVVATALGFSLVPLTQLWPVAAVLAALVFLIMPMNSGMAAYRLHITPDEMQGRSSAASGFVSMAMIPVANSLAGVLLEHWGRSQTVGLFATATALALLIALGSRAVRAIPRATEFSA